MARWRNPLFVEVALIAAVHAAACAFARFVDFDHISDDDFARVTIAQTFAHAPRLDPSGTSWLPFPFWTMGAVMGVFGRSLGVARAAAIAFASLAAAAPYAALRFNDVPRGRALLALLFGYGTAWMLWTGAATVPESFTASLTAAGLIGLATARTPRAVMAFAAALAAACLSRYEAWPAAAAAGAALALRARHDAGQRRVLALGATLCVLGPLAWMAWNAHAHDGPLHFFRRVSTYKQALGAGSTSTVGAVLEYPLLLLATRPEVVIPAVFLIATSLRDDALRLRWLVPLLAVGAQLAFLAYGNARDGSPAHHAERALLGAHLVLALFVADAGLVRLREVAGLPSKAAAACVAVAWAISTVRSSTMPGSSASEDRTVQIARGEALRAQGAVHLVVTPCAFEHFALLAAFGAPERAEVGTATALPAGSQCPDIRLE